MKILQITLLILIIASGFITAQNNGWSNPVPIDSTRQFFWPLIAVSPQGQIATLGFGGSLYISDDNGKSFQLRYEFKPPVQYYQVFTPLGLAYDSNSVLWIYLAWDECSDEVCTFTIQRKLYLSRSTDGGNTFEHILQFKGYFSLADFGPANPVMFMEEDNTIHFLRDSSWYNGSFTEFYLIYSKIPQGDLTERTEVLLPEVPDSLEMTGHFFIIPSDKKPLCIVPMYNRIIGNENNTYYFYTKYKDNGEFSEYQLLDSLKSGEVGKINLFNFNNNKVHLKYRVIKYEPAEKFYYYVMISDNGGDTFNTPIQTNEEVFNINHTDDNYFYAINYFFSNQRSMYYIFVDIFSSPIDSADLGFARQTMYSCIDNNGGKYVLFTNAQHKTYFIGKDIITSINEEIESNLWDGVIKLSISPNPFNTSAIISFSLSKQGRVDIVIYDISGKKIEEIQNYNANSGENKIRFEAENLASGAYVVTLYYNNVNYTAKALLVK